MDRNDRLLSPVHPHGMPRMISVGPRVEVGITIKRAGSLFTAPWNNTPAVICLDSKPRHSLPQCLFLATVIHPLLLL